MKLFTLSLALLIGSMPQAHSAEEPLSPQRMAERIFLFHDIQKDVLAQAQIMTMVAPMPVRLQVRQKYFECANRIDYQAKRAAFTKSMLTSFTAEEISELYRFRFDKCLLINDRLAKIRAEVLPVSAACSLHLKTGIDGLGDFAIEHKPEGVSEEKLKLVIDLASKSTAQGDDIELKSLQQQFAEQGFSPDDAKTVAEYWVSRIGMAGIHAAAKHLTEQEIRDLFSAQAEPKLAKLIAREDVLVQAAIESCTSEILAGIVKSNGK